LGDKIGRVTPSGIITEFAISPGSYPVGITSGPDGNVWFTERFGHKIGRITPDGDITEFVVPHQHWVTEITTGPDGNLWFTENDSYRIGRMTVDGVIAEFQTGASTPTGITSGADGNVWFTDYYNSKHRVGQITPEGTITWFPFVAFSGARNIVLGPDGNLWFTITSDEIAMITDEPAPAVAVDPASGPPETVVRVTGSGFGALEPVRVSLLDSAGAHIRLAKTRTDSRGSLQPAVTIPPGAIVGTQVVRAKGSISGIVAKTTFLVT
jgi:streptogramin lyase